MTGDPTARALRAVRALAADLAAERRTNVALRRQVAELEAELERLRSAVGAPRVRTTREASGTPAAVPVARRP